jgi:hypothetical protein
VTEHVPGRYLLHDLVRVYGIELGADVDPAEERAEAILRVLGHYLHSAHAANILLLPSRSPGWTTHRRV